LDLTRPRRFAGCSILTGRNLQRSMAQPRRVCIAVDGGPASAAALEWAARSLVGGGDAVRLFTVVPPSQPGSSGSALVPVASWPVRALPRPRAGCAPACTCLAPLPTLSRCGQATGRGRSCWAGARSGAAAKQPGPHGGPRGEPRMAGNVDSCSAATLQRMHGCRYGALPCLCPQQVQGSQMTTDTVVATVGTAQDIGALSPPLCPLSPRRCRALRRCGACSCHVCLRLGQTAGRVIVRYASECGCETVVVGSRGLGLSRRALLDLFGVGSGALVAVARRTTHHGCTAAKGSVIGRRAAGCVAQPTVVPAPQ
jgi:nucleotide-binding universal stress UspA family protein